MSRNFVAASLQYLSLDGAPPATAPPFTMSCWFKPVSTAVDYSLVSLSSATADQQFTLRARSGGIVGIQARAGATNVTTNSTTTYSAGVWNNAVGVYTATNDRTIYLNGGGSANSTTSVVLGTTPTRFRIGVLNHSTNFISYMDGDLAEVGVWDAALTAVEQAILATGVSPLAVRPASLVAYCPLVGKFSPEIDILRPNALTLNAAPVAGEHPRVFYTRPTRNLKLINPIVAPATLRLLALTGVG